MSGVLFSVIVPVYNVESYLKQCIDSILAQTYRNFELILVDDGSQDSSGTICDEYAVRDSRIIVIHKENQGQLSARRIGLNISSGKFVCFIDSDDQVRANLLQKVAAVITNFSVDVITFNWAKIDMYGNILCKEISIFTEGKVDKEKYFKKILSSAALNSLCKKIFRRTLFDLDTDYSGYYKVQNGEDLLQTIAIMYRANSFFYIDEALYMYRMNPESITHRYMENEYKILDVVRPALYKCMVDLGYDSAENKCAFFQYYLQLLWLRLYRYCTNEKCDFKVMNEIYQYRLVGESRQYCSLADRRSRLGLKLFFKKHWTLMNFVFKVDNRLTENMRKIIEKINSNGCVAE